MLKCLSTKFQTGILKLFNLVLSVGYYPDIWNQGLITPIFKSGDKFDPSNYRGICVNSNLGKLFCSIINSRVLNFLTEHNTLSKCQIGFLPNYRTSDHIFTLHTLIERHVIQNKTKIYACFIDFKQAFDSIWHTGLFYKVLESGVGGKTYDLIKSMYSRSECAIKIGSKRTKFLSQGRGVRQGCCLSPTLFNIYINELAKTIEKSTAPGVTLHDSETKLLLYADDLVLLSPTEQGLQQNLDLLEQYCQTWALAVNLNKTKIMIFEKRSRSQVQKHNFTIGPHSIEHTNNYRYLGLIINSNGKFNLAVNDLREKARRAFYAIKRQIPVEIPIRIWLKLFESVIEPIALYGSEVWGPLTNQEFNKWEKHPIETLHAEFCKSILKVHRCAIHNACRAELGQYPLITKIQKRAIKFWKHLKSSDPHSHHYKALQYQELSKDTCPLTQLVLSLSSPDPHTHTNTLLTPQDQYRKAPEIRINQIGKTIKQNYISHWKTQTKTQSKMQFYLALNRNYDLAPYLTLITDKNLRTTLTKYRLSEHSLAIEVGRHRQTWLPKENRLCPHCEQGTVETELHFLTQCTKYEDIRLNYFKKISEVLPEFLLASSEERLSYLTGENEECLVLAAQYVTSCHKRRESP